jgi:hypothetical protein
MIWSYQSTYGQTRNLPEMSPDFLRVSVYKSGLYKSSDFPVPE